MVRRSSDRPTGVLGNVVDNQRQIEGITRALGRGSAALRGGRNVIEVNREASTPMLVPVGMDSALTFTPDGKVAITDGTGTQDRDMTVRHISSSGTLTAQGDVIANGGARFNASVTTYGDFIANGGAWFNGVLTSGQHNMGVSPLYCGQVNCGGLSAGTGNIGTQGLLLSGGNWMGPTQLTLGLSPVYAGDGNFQRIFCPAINPPSDERLKEGFRPVDSGMLDRLLTTPVQRWRWKVRREWDEDRDEWLDRTPDDREHTHPVAQDMPPELVTETSDGDLAVDLMSEVGALLAIVQRQQQQIDALVAEVGQLRTELRARGPAGPIA